MADVVDQPTPPARPDETALARPRPTPNVPRHRFGVAYLALAGILGVAVGLFVVLVANGGKDSGPAWSVWKPQESTFVHRLNEISKFVEDGYALSNGQKLALILSTPPETQGQGQPVPLRAIVVSSGLPGETSRDASFYDASSAWAYVFRGLGDKGVLPGKASLGRFDLLRREALELSLYTFKYQSGVDSIVTYLPPARGAAPNTAIFLRRQDVAPALKNPLATTLTPSGNGLRPGEMASRDLETVQLYTNDRLYRYGVQQLQDGTPVLVLIPPRA